jgi:hypothetical protein
VTDTGAIEAAIDDGRLLRQIIHTPVAPTARMASNRTTTGQRRGLGAWTTCSAGGSQRVIAYRPSPSTPIPCSKTTSTGMPLLRSRARSLCRVGVTTARAVMKRWTAS